MELKLGFKHTEVGTLPEDWRVTSIAGVCDIIVDCKNRTPPVVDGGDYAVVRTPNVRDGRFVREDLRFTDLKSYREWTARTVPKVGDVLITREAPLGEVCLVPADVKVCLGQRMMLYRPDQTKTTDRYLLYALTSEGVRSNLLKKIGGSTVGHAKVDDIRLLQIPMPSTKTEQTAIAAVLGDVDVFIESLEQLLVKKRRIRQGAIQDLLTGRRRLPGFCGHWEMKRLGDTAEFKKGKGLPKSALSPFGAHQCIHYGELFTRYPETIRSIISRTDYFFECVRSVANDVLMPTSDVTPAGLAKASCVLEDGVVLGGDILVIRSDKTRILGSFLSYVIRFEERQILTLVSGTTVFHLYPSDMRKFVFSAPPLQEQHAIVSILHQIDAEISALVQTLTKVRQLRFGMMQELLAGRIRLL